MADVQVSQGDVTTVLENSGDNLQLSQAGATVVYNFPAEFTQSSQADLTYVGTLSSHQQVSQVGLTVVMRGRTDDPSVRAWTFTLDGHDFYVLRLGTTETLVYDMTTDTWYNWGSGDTPLWSVYNGINWTDGNGFAAEYGSNVLVGSDSNGALFFLDPSQAFDNAAAEGREGVPFTRRVTGQLAYRGYERVSVYQTHLIGSVGELLDPDYNTITLSYSDDRGDTYLSAGTVTIADGDYDVRAVWRSLGSFSNPGRLFRLEDDGALARVDSLTVDSDLSNGS